MDDEKWFIGDMISQLEEKQYRMCIWIKNIEPHRQEREKLVEAVRHLSYALSALDGINEIMER